MRTALLFASLIMAFVVHSSHAQNTYDLKMQSTNMNGAVEVQNCVTGMIKNKGTATVNSFDMKWQIGNGPIGMRSYGGLSLAPNDVFMISSGFAEAMGTPGNNVNVKVWIDNPNGQVDEFLGDNTISSTVYISFGPVSTRNVLVESFVGTWGGWNPRAYVYDEIIDSLYPEAIVVEHHNADPMAHPSFDSLFGLIQGFPDGMIDREVTLLNTDPAFYPTEVPLRIAEPADACITASATSSAPHTIDLDVQVEILDTNQLFQLGIGWIVIEDSVTGTLPGYAQANYYAGGGNGPMGGYENLPDPVPANQMVYNNVARLTDAVNPFGNSAPLPPITNTNTIYTYTNTITLDSFVNFANTSVVFYVAKVGFDYEVLNSLEVPLGDTMSTACGATSFAACPDTVAQNNVQLVWSGSNPICPGEQITVANTGVSYLWSTGDTTASINVNSAGAYWVIITDTGSGISDTSHTLNLNMAGTVSADFTYSIGNGQVTLTQNCTGPVQNYFWDLGNGQFDFGPTVTTQYTQLGTYIVTLYADGPCGVDSIADTIYLSGISGMIYADSNGNGMQDIGENGVPGVQILVAPDSNIIYTDINGNYAYTTTVYDTFTITVVPPPHIFNCSGLVSAFATVTEPVSGSYEVIISAVNLNDTANDFGLEPPSPPCGSISGTIWNDANQNGIQDPGELPFAGVQVVLSNGLSTVSNTFGHYQIDVPFNTPVTVSVVLSSSYTYCANLSQQVQTFPTIPGTYSVTLTAGSPSSNNNDFGIYESASFDAGMFSLATYYVKNAGQVAYAYMDFKTLGNPTDTCVLRIDHDSLVSLQWSSIPATNVGATYVEWVFLPGQYPGSWYCMGMDWYLDSSAVAGTQLTWIANYGCGGPDACPANDSIVTIVTIASGPLKRSNDAISNTTNQVISLLPQGVMPDVITNADSVFSYVILFQNITDDTVFNMLIVDSISEHLDMSTMTFPFSNLPFDICMSEGMAVFDFQDILLTDTGSFLPGSYGFLQYNIRTKPNLTPGTEITNKADIYFNYYDPIPTNRESNWIAGSTGQPEIPKDLNALVFPNPAEDRLFVSIIDNNAVVQLDLLDAVGNTITTQHFQHNIELDISSLATGVYFVRMTSDRGRVLEKVVKF